MGRYTSAHATVISTSTAAFLVVCPAEKVPPLSLAVCVAGSGVILHANAETGATALADYGENREERA